MPEYNLVAKTKFRVDVPGLELKLSVDAGDTFVISDEAQARYLLEQYSPYKDKIIVISRPKAEAEPVATAEVEAPEVVEPVLPVVENFSNALYTLPVEEVPVVEEVLPVTEEVLPVVEEAAPVVQKPFSRKKV